MQTWKTRDFVLAGLYTDEEAVVQDAMRALLSERPQLRLELAIHRYRAEQISLAKAAALAGVEAEKARRTTKPMSNRTGTRNISLPLRDLRLMYWFCIVSSFANSDEA